MQNEGKDYKTMLISSFSSLSTSLHSDVASKISCFETSLSNGFKSGSLKIVPGLVGLVFIFFVSIGKFIKGVLIRRGAHLKIFTLGEPFIRGGALSRKYGISASPPVFSPLHQSKVSILKYSLL